MLTGDAIEKRLKLNYERPRIGKSELSYHAVRRAIERQLRAEWIAEALLMTPGPAKRGALQYVGPWATAIVNPRTREIITVRYGAFNQR